MADHADLRTIFNSLLIVLESQQRRIDELIETVNATKGAASDVVPGFPERFEDLAAEISHHTQHHVAEKADQYAELRALIVQMLP